MTDDNTSKCPLCLNQCQHVTPLYCPPEFDSLNRVCPPKGIDTGFLYNCDFCGSFVITSIDRNILLDKKHQNETNILRLSALLRERSIQKGPAVWIRFRDDKEYAKLVDKNTQESPNCVPMPARELLSHWPHTVPDKLDRTLQNLAGLSPKGGVNVELRALDCGVCFASDMGELRYHVNSLEAQGLLHEPRHTLSNDLSTVVVSAEGWARVDELTRGAGSPENPAFVAMWFGGKDRTDEMTDLYENSMKRAVEHAGYRVTRVDREEHNDFVMDKVLGGIRLAPFVVADFTGNRGGVYFEAGFARGLGIPVIHTCKEVDFGEAHFDIKQVNTIRWKQPDNLFEKLYHRIRGTLGEGPYKRLEP